MIILDEKTKTINIPFGINPNYNINDASVYFDTSDATAVAGDLLIGKTAYSNGGKITGTLVVNNTIDVAETGIKLSKSTFTTIPSVLDFENVEDFSYMFSECNNLTGVFDINTSSAINMRRMFYQSYNIINIGDLDTSKVTDFSYFLYGVMNYTSLPLLDMSSAENISSMLYGNTAALTDIAGFVNLGKGFTSETASNHNLMLFSNNLTRQSVLNVFNNLYNMNLITLTTGATITMQPTVKALLTDDDIAIATNKGWIVA